MKLQKKNGSLNRKVRVTLFVIILLMGTISTVMTDKVSSSEASQATVVPARTMTVAIQDNRLLAALIDPVRPTGIYQSEDRGRSWELLSSGTNISHQVIFVHSADSDVLYARTIEEAASPSNSLWRSDNSGRNWRSLTPGLPVAPYNLPWAISERSAQPRPPQLFYMALDEYGGYYFDLQQSRYGYELVSALSPQAYLGAGLNDAVIAPDGKIYMLTSGNEPFTRDSGSWRQLGALLESAAGLLSAHFSVNNQSGMAYGAAGREQYRGQLRHNLDISPGTALRITALAADEQEESQLFVAAAVYDQDRRWGDKGIYASSDAGRHWTRLAGNNGLVVMQLPEKQLSDEVSTNRGPDVLDTPYLATPFSDHSQPFNGTQVLIMLLAGSLAGLTLTDRADWTARPGRTVA